ncbi:hypothetical protein K8I85_11195 [bacterium]|nr:hypothetical protein [bacterium]
MWNRIFAAAFGLVAAAGLGAPASASQLGVGLHYLRAIDEFEGVDEVSQNDVSLFGTLTIPFVLARVEGNLEWSPDYLGSSESLFQPAAYGLMPFGLLYGGVGVGIGYLTGEDGGWASSPFYALRAGVELGLAGLAVDAFASYRFQNASFAEGAGDIDLDTLTLAAQVKFGG